MKIITLLCCIFSCFALFAMGDQEPPQKRVKLADVENSDQLRKHVQNLIDQGKDLSGLDGGESPLLNLRFYDKCPDLLDPLLKLNADVNIQWTGARFTPLEMVLYYRWEEVGCQQVRPTGDSFAPYMSK